VGKEIRFLTLKWGNQIWKEGSWVSKKALQKIPIKRKAFFGLP